MGTEKTSWHGAAEAGSLQFLETWIWAKKAQLNPDQLKNKLLLAQD
jgi:hypothetical protein